MDVNLCVHVGLRPNLLTFTGDLRYKMLLIQTCAMHQDINSQDISKVHACVFGLVKTSMRTLYKLISIIVVYQLALMKENVHRGGHALTSLMFAFSVIML